ncbi:glycosyltransferase [Sinomonas humi]|uniref:glycosyltransferase n=1 Tax=Sinomonas humi TaxID=1338436 RepID=UPI0018CF1BC7|nr:glycosyltransferase [Sinomonas humi]
MVPEYYGPGLDSLPKGVGKIIFNQGAHHTFDRLDFEATAPGAPYRDLPDLRGILTVSEDSRRLLSLAFPDLSISMVRNVVDQKIFHAGAQERKRQIAFVPSRRFEEFEQLRHVLRSRGLGWELMPIRGLAEVEVARVLRESAIFLSLSDRDGFGLPAAEAMACGCYVVGYTGGGGDEFFDPAFSAPVSGFVELLENLIRATEQPLEVLADRGLQASAAILSRYTAEGLRGDLMEFYGQHLGS